MDQISYVGEHLIWGKLGHAAILLGFCTALFSFLAYTFKVNSGKDSWLKLGRIGFGLHAASIFALIFILMYIMVNKYYEYAYVYEHVSDNLPMEYILSAFWEGQEGSFILWMFWHIILGLILIWKAGSKWEAPVMAIMALVALTLNSMILGIYMEIGDFVYKFGLNPLLLLRDTMEAPIFGKADYVSLLQGTGLNPLLQNYWNVIHPPTLFLGYTSTVVPFAYAIAGLWTKDHKAWLTPALKWGLFSAGIFGTGILMGSAWAYEALSFGGYWAWDPVENTSFVPWITVVAGLHANLIARNTGHSIKSTYFLYIISFVLVANSSFMTKSGVLGDTSVHTFTSMGLEWQLAAMVIGSLLLGLVFMIIRNKSIPVIKREESSYSREFWMFIGSLVLLFSATLITASTSLPVFNSMMTFFDENYIGKVIDDPIPHYNKYQIWISIMVSILSGVTLFFRYKDEANNRVIKALKRFGISAFLALIFTYLFTLWQGLHSWQYYLLCWSSFVGAFMSLDYMIFIAKGNLKVASSAISHFGFSVMIIGILASGLNSYHISNNPFVFKEILNKDDLGKYILIYKDEPMFMNGYFATYTGDTLVGNTKTFFINMKKVNEQNETTEEFTLTPSIIYNKEYSEVKAYNPDSEHYFHKDIFTNIILPKYQESIKEKEMMEDSLNFVQYDVFAGDTIQTKYSTVIVGDYSLDRAKVMDINPKDELVVSVPLTFISESRDTTIEVNPGLSLDEELIFNYPQKIERLNTIAKIDESFFEQVFTSEKDLEYTTITIKQGDQFKIGDIEFRLNGFDQNIDNPNYEKQDKDLAVAASVSYNLNGEVKQMRPLYILRGNRPFSIKAYEEELGIHLRLANINPKTDQFTLKYAMDDRDNIQIPVVIAEEVPRTDLLIFEARVFPGINLFWAGSIIMVLGFFIALYRRMMMKS